MLPLLCLLSMKLGSSRESFMDELLVCSFPPLTKALTLAALRR